MKLRLIKQSPVAHRPIQELVEMYSKRLGRFIPTQKTVLKNKSLYKKNGFIVLLDPRGKLLTTDDLVEKIQTLQNYSPHKSIEFVVGDSYGFDDKDRKQADLILSLSNFTMAGDIAWLTLWEQVYRVFSIINGQPYHHE